jgi:hypothetical protein
MLRSIVHAHNRYPLKGGSFIGKVGRFFRKAGHFLKRTRALSSLGTMASPFFPALAGPTAAARVLGYGRRHHRRVHRRMGMGMRHRRVHHRRLR